MSEITLNGWSIRQFSGPNPVLIAHTVSNHPHIGTGSYRRSSLLVWLSEELGLAMTLNTLYRLEQPLADVADDSNVRRFIHMLHPDNVPPEIRREHAARKPWPHTDFDTDAVYQWSIERFKNEPIVLPF